MELETQAAPFSWIQRVEIAGCFLVLFCNQKRTYLAVMLFTKGIKLNLRENALNGKQIIKNRSSGYY